MFNMHTLQNTRGFMKSNNSTERFIVKTYSDEEYNRTVSRIRTWLYSLVRRRNSGVVTADDVHTYLNREGVRPQQVRTRLSFINSVLRSPNFEYAGMTSSTRPAAKGRVITEWTA
jgi:hypothetical protein